MRTITKNLYTFDELSQEAKKKALSNNLHFNVEFGDWYTFIIEERKNQLTAQGYRDADIEFSGFYSQGDGANFTATVDVLAQLQGRSLALPLLTKLGDKLVNLITECVICRNTSHYSHENTVSLNLELDDELVSASIAEHNKKQFDDEITKLERLIIDDARTEMHKIYKALEEEYTYLTSDEQIAESLRVNEMEFYENGENFLS